jgi:hypothetical protein
MSVINMTRAGVINGNENVWEVEDSLASVTTGNIILIPGGIIGLSITVSVGGGASAKAQYSTDTLNTILNGTPIWLDWPAGAVASNTADRCAPVSAIRLNQTVGGTSKLTARAQ